MSYVPGVAHFIAVVFIAAVCAAAPAAGAELREATLTIARESVRIDGVESEAMTINGAIPGPTLRWRVGDLARIHVRNTLDVPSSIHWHGLLVPNRQDGVPGITTPGIRPGSTHTFEIPIRQAGTYWYHSHTGLQEQRGVYGSIVIEPEDERAGIEVDRDLVVVLSDWTRDDPREILRLLKRGSEHFSIEKGTAQSLWGALRAGALGSVARRAWARMPPMDVSDVAYDAFLTNGSPVARFDAPPGERIRVRVINAAASTYFYLGLGGGGLRTIAADGADIEPVRFDRILMAVAETYDFVVEVPERGSVELRATAQDGSGTTSAYFGSGEPIRAADVPPPDPYAMSHGDHGKSVDHTPVDHSKHEAMGHSMPSTPLDERPLPPYDQLRAAAPSELPGDAPVRSIRLRLTGDMERYVWSFDGRTLAEADLIPVKRGEVLRVELENSTMMHHPLHLHGHFFRVLGGDTARAPLKHTVDVAPMQTTTIEFFADADKDWFFHCHVLYHMKAGMARVFHYEGSEPDADLIEERRRFFRDPWYAWAEASAMSHYTEGIATTSNSSHELAVEWEVGWQDVPEIDHEVLPLYRYHANRFYRAFAGASLEEERNAGVFGVEALLPLNFESRAWVDTQGEGRFTLGKELALTARLVAIGEVKYDTKQEWEGSAGLRWLLHRYGSLAFQWHSEFGFGGGIELLF
ncbi:MAG: multicopper oxidase domain-containing protein [Myxococcales bacterium]|nr:multicopper oxidase domain-containing protein [Myxococcales bacterium]